MKTYTSEQLFEIIDLNDWSSCTCNHEPEPNVDTIQIALEEEAEYFGAFVGDPVKDEYTFEFYT